MKSIIALCISICAFSFCQAQSEIAHPIIVSSDSLTVKGQIMIHYGDVSLISPHLTVDHARVVSQNLGTNSVTIVGGSYNFDGELIVKTTATDFPPTLTHTFGQETLQLYLSTITLEQENPN